jgi:Tfp pilus assembly PilM family ATPase
MRSFDIPFEKAETIKHSYRENHPELEQYKALLDTGYDQIIAEAKTIMTDYQRVSEKSVTKIILSGGGSLYAPLPERVYTAFSLPTELLASFEKTEYPEFLGDILKKSGPTFGVATGLALKELI